LALAGLLVLAAGASAGEGRRGRSVLVFPLESHWLSAPLAEAVTEALPGALGEAGFTVTVWRHDSAFVRRALDERKVQVAAGPGRGAYVRDQFAVAAGADVYLVGEVVEVGGEAQVKAEVVGAVSRRGAEMSASTPVGEDTRAPARELASQLAAAMTPQVWTEVEADEAGRRAAAAERYASGRMAMAQGMYRDADSEFEAALAGEWDNPEYLWWAAEAEVKMGDLDGALAHLQALARRAPESVEARLRIGDVALMAGRPEQAEAAFRAAGELHGEEPGVIEGLARAARARGDFARAEEHYRRLVSALPALAGEPPWLPTMLAHLPGDPVQLTAAVPGEEHRYLGRMYLEAGRPAEGVRALLKYHSKAEGEPYGDEEYLAVAAALDEECHRVAERVGTVTAARRLGQISGEQAADEVGALHEASERMAALAEKMQVEPGLDPGHRYRVFAYALLSQSNFEALMFLHTNDAERNRRAELLRDAHEKACAQARELSFGLVKVED
jgi:hypothetical protein